MSALSQGIIPISVAFQIAFRCPCNDPRMRVVARFMSAALRFRLSVESLPSGASAAEPANYPVGFNSNSK